MPHDDNPSTNRPDAPIDQWRRPRRKMVQRQLFRRGITNRRTLAAVAKVPREQFVDESQRMHAYDDQPLPIGHNQTISQPYMVGAMTDLLQLDRHCKVLEVGTGSGYQTAVLSVIAQHVWSVERIREHSETAAQRLKALGYENVTLIVGDGAQGFQGGAPYDAILVAAATPEVPAALIAQLAESGRIIAPIGNRATQRLTLFTKTADGMNSAQKMDCRFVPLISPHAFD